MRSNQELVEYIRREKRISSATLDAFMHVDRADFVTSDQYGDAYGDFPLPIGEEQTISQPSTVAFMLDELDVQPGMKVLDVGCGSGYTTALLGRLVGDTGLVIGVERIPYLVSYAGNNLQTYHDLPVQVYEAIDRLGFPRYAPYDRILVSAESDEVPSALLEQLAAPGVMVLPVAGSIYTVRKDSRGEISQTRYPGFMFVPLVQ